MTTTISNRQTTGTQSDDGRATIRVTLIQSTIQTSNDDGRYSH